MMPEVEDLTMHLAELARIETVPHTLMRMADNTLCYLSRRIDRTTILNPKDDEELALTLNAKKKRIKREDFILAAQSLGIDTIIVERLFAKFIKLLPSFIDFVQNSFLSDDLKAKYIELLENRVARLR